MTKIAEIIFEGGMQRFLWRKRMEQKLKKIKDHYIICGCGRIGGTVLERLEQERISLVVIDSCHDALSEFPKSGTRLYIHGDATQEDVLIQAGVKRARALAALLPTDADNLYLVLTAKLLNPSLYVLSKALEEDGEKKILQIGANKIISPYKLSALRIAEGLIRPTVVDFVDLIIRRKEISLNMEELVLNRYSRLVGRSLKESDIRKKANVIVAAIKKPGEDIVFNPSPEEKFEIGDTLLVLGDKETIGTFERYFISGKA
jgi:voltage-gated potassium channel